MSSSKGPGLFSDIGRKARDLLVKDYHSDQKLHVSSTSESGLGITSAAVKKGGLYAFDVSTQYKYKNTVADVKIDTESKISTTFTVSEVLPFTKAIVTLKFPDYNAGKVDLQYFHDHASFSTVFSLKQSPPVDLSATIGAHGVAFGAEAGLDTASGAFTKYNAGIGLTKPDYIASVILADKGDTLTASYVYHLDEKQKSSIVGEITRRFSTNENTFTVGGAYAVDPQTTVKSRLNNSGKLGAVLQHEVVPKSILTICGEFDTKALDKTPKFGLGLAVKL